MTGSTSLRVLLVTPVYPPPPGGIQTLVVNLEEGLRRGDCTVQTLVVDPEEYDSNWRDYVPSQANLEAVRSRRPHRLVYHNTVRRRSKEIIESFDPDIVHAMHVREWPALEVARGRGIPTVLTIHALELGDKGATKSALERADSVHAVSEFTAKLVEQTYGVQIDAVIPPSIDVESYSRREHPSQGKIAGDVFSISRFVDRKNISTIISAWDRLSDPVKDGRRLVIAGGGPNYDDIADAVKGRDDIELLGWIDEETKRTYLSDASLFVLPASGSGFDVEGFGIVYIEAQASGTPVIGSTVGGVPEAVGDGGRLIDDEQNPEELAAAIEALLNDESQWKDCRSAAITRVKKFDIQPIAERYRSLYESLLS